MENESSSSEGEEESLNVFSSEFDPLAVLYKPSLTRLPDPSAPVLDNVERFLSVSEGRRSNKPDPAQPGPSGMNTERHFKPEQMPLPGKQRKKGPNVWSFMDRVSGPLAFLKKAREEQCRIRVYTRGPNYLRGNMTAYLLAFDKHWNMALVDVDEVFRKRRCPKAMLDPSTSSEREEEEGVKIVRNSRRWLHCERHVAQIVLRGEHVSHVVIL
uniref:U7 snRNA-associated Sm-like protein LSm11 n=1 Tax=Caligus rogercresseyi TaxID=217165 RepID=C1BRG8_CALRO|nr:U7 snRNA-associated Sm-like protein LSm11 [Caligus rogercresseyi]|eukprot:TRINITY_DN4407_c0_g1_i1.p1 TRINITY_DN4407_c0_g1~~TRINITY_DN4407_c0_g1_i1.p1  ORF type:complete len:213 (-),score=53.46 TRINITY_DN4407_c0_g1_i1:86-724(-)